jgi:exodeoxyribonuclease V alpha subunit
VSVGVWFGFDGKWVDHPQYGRQIQILRAPVLKDGIDIETAGKMLISAGVGELLVKRLHHHFGDDFIDALEDSSRLEKAPSMTNLTALHLASRWRSAKAHFQVLDFLNDLDVPKGKITKIWAHFGDKTQDILTQNPWSLVELEGLTFKVADEVARKLGLDLNDLNRVKGAALYAIKTQKEMGHLYLLTGQLLHLVRQNIPDLEPKQLAVSLGDLSKAGLVHLDRETRPGTTAIYEPWFYKVEEESTALLRERVGHAGLDNQDRIEQFVEQLASVGPKTMKTAGGAKKKIQGWKQFSKKRADDLVEGVAQQAIDEWGELAKVNLTPDQIQGVRNALLNPVSVISGLPGTGKTTSLRTLVRIIQSTGLPYLLVAPTGIAAKRLEAVTGSKAKTIHRAFQASGISAETREFTYAGIVGDSQTRVEANSSEEWGHSQSNPHPAQFVVIDEASMVDQALLYRLLAGTSRTCRLVFVGDAAQLPSVGPGNVLRDLIDSDSFPTVSLTEIFRQEDTSDIVYAAHEIHAGRVPDAGQKSDFALVGISDETKVLAAILKIAEKLYRDRENFQILSPRHTGTVGVTNLNSRLRELLNPKSPGVQEIRLGSGDVREGDRVMVVKNNYKLHVYNGDVGKISRIDRRTKEVEVKIHDTRPLLVRFSFKDAPRYLRLAYACTIHKSQGQEYGHIVMPLVDSFHHQLQRNLLYTGVTRAKEKVILVGTHSALERAVGNNKEQDRNTLFIDRLRHAFVVGG